MSVDLILATCPLFALDDHICPGRLFDVAAAAASADVVVSTPDPVMLTSSSGDGCHDGSIYDADSSSSSLLSAVEQVTSCITTGSSCSCIFVVVTLLGIYVMLAVVMNLIACYNFVMAWNLITRIYHVDLTFMSRRHHHHHLNHHQYFNYSYHQRSSCTLSSTSSSSMPFGKGHFSFVHVDGMKDTCCPVCLEDFFEQESVTACDEGCGAWFHKDCLVEWLDRSDSCPCCRRDMVTPRPRSCWHDLTVFLGYAPQ